MNNFLTTLDSQILASSLKSFGYAQLINEATQNLASQALALSEANLNGFKKAKIGQGRGRSRDEEIRKDQTLWLEDSLYTQIPSLQSLYNDLMLLGRENLFLPVKRYECHFSYYGEGDFYLKHRDRHKGSKNRLLTVLFYLNTLAEEGGGSLILYLENGETIEVQPERGKLFIFDSQLEHEVKVCHSDRWAISGWLRDDELLY